MLRRILEKKANKKIKQILNGGFSDKNIKELKRLTAIYLQRSELAKNIRKQLIRIAMYERRLVKEKLSDALRNKLERKLQKLKERLFE